MRALRRAGEAQSAGWLAKLANFTKRYSPAAPHPLMFIRFTIFHIIPPFHWYSPRVPGLSNATGIPGMPSSSSSDRPVGGRQPS